MKLLTRTFILAVTAVMAATPLGAQSRSGAGNNSRSSYSSPSRQSSVTSKGLGSSSSGTRTQSSSQASRPSSSVSRSSSSASRPAASTSRSTSTVSRSQSAPAASGGSVSRSSGTVNRSGASSGTSGSVSRPNPSTSTVRTGSASSARTGVSGSNSTVRSSASGTAAVRSGSGTTVRSNATATVRTKSTTAPANRESNNGINPHGGNTPGSQPATVRQPEGPNPRNFNGGDAPRQVRMDNDRNVRRVPPREREPMPFNRPARFWDGGPHYFGYRVTYLPPRFVRHDYWGRPYYLCDGIWYRYYNSCYYVCRPPFGYSFIPEIVSDIVYSACRFAYYSDVYRTFNTINENASTIAEQNRIIARNNATIAQQNADIALNTQKAQEAYAAANAMGLVQSYADASVEYYYDDGVFFTKGADGKYTVIVPPAGALVQELPDDYDTITIEGKEYYKVDDTVFEMTIVDGSAYFQVLGQLTGELAEKFDQNK